LIYNNLIKKYKLQNKYPFIRDKDKIKFIYLKQNPMRENVIGFFQTIPEEFGLAKYIDYNLQFQKGFINSLERILKCLNWKTEKVIDIGDFF
jgi:hypothetical protein